MKKNLFVLATMVLLVATANVAVAQTTSTDPLGNVWTRATSGSGEANYWVDQLGFADVAAVQDALNHYYTQCPAGTSERWGDGWLSKFVANLLAVRGWNCWSQLDQQQQSQLVDVMSDAVNESTFRLDSSCGLDQWNSCSEDFVSFLSLISRVKNFYPQVVERVGANYLNNLEQKYLHLVFTTDDGYYSLVHEQTLDGVHTLMHNHGEQSAVYSGALLMYTNLAIESYSLAGNRVPLYFVSSEVVSNVRDMFSWMQTLSTSDGSAFLANCMNYQGNLVSCGDVTVTNAIPQVIPAGRFIHNLFGDGGFIAGMYEYRLFDTSYTAGNVWNRGRQADWNLDDNEFSISWMPRAPSKHLQAVKLPTIPTKQ